MENLTMPKITEHVKTTTLKGGKVTTVVAWFLINPEVFDSICSGFIRGEVSILEARIGSAIKSPKDVYDKPLALKLARERLQKNKLPIHQIGADKKSAWICAEGYTVEKFTNGKIIVYTNLHSK